MGRDDLSRTPAESPPFSPAPRRYLAFLGRISQEKRVDRADCDSHRHRTTLLKIAASGSRRSRILERRIRHLLEHGADRSIGEISETEKAAFLGGASALLFPIDWPEPFGLVMIEALACGTPVVAFRGGSVPEVLEDGVTGFVVDSLENAIAATRKVEDVDRRRCRAVFERRFSVGRMARDYLRCMNG